MLIPYPLGHPWVFHGENTGITRFPQEGNPKPRMFRANKENALVNRMGLNNPGWAMAIKDKLLIRKSSNNWPNIPVAANMWAVPVKFQMKMLPAIILKL